MKMLEGDGNWHTWKIQMKALLMEKKLWGYVNGSTKLKVDPSEKDIENHEHKLQCAYTKIIMSLSTSCVALCQDCVTAKEVWTMLEKQFDKKAGLAKLRIKCKYMTTKLIEGGSAEAHIRELKDLTDQLSIMGSLVSDEDQAMVLLLSLPPSYTTLVNTLSAPGEFKLDVIVNGIMEYECRTVMSKTDIGSEHALYVAVKPRGNPKKDGQYKNYYHCHTCNTDTLLRNVLQERPP